MTHAIISLMCCSVFHCFIYVYSLGTLAIWNLKYSNSYNYTYSYSYTSTTGENTSGIRYFKLPFVGDFSTVTRKKLKHL